MSSLVTNLPPCLKARSKIRIRSHAHLTIIRAAAGASSSDIPASKGAHPPKLMIVNTIVPPPRVTLWPICCAIKRMKFQPMILFIMLSTLPGLIFWKPKHLRMLSHRSLEMVGVAMAFMGRIAAPIDDARIPWRRRRILSSIAWSIFGSTSTTCAAVHLRRASSLMISSRVWFIKNFMDSSSSVLLSGSSNQSTRLKYL